MGEEKTLQTLILEDLESRPGFVVWKLIKANINGLADVWFAYPKGVGCVEVKRLGEVPKPHQRMMMNRLNATGGMRAFWCDSWAGWCKIKAELF